MNLALTPLKQFAPQPGSVPQHPPIRVHIDPVEPTAGGIKGINHLDLNGIASVVKSTLHGLRGTQVPRAHSESQNANALLNHEENSEVGTRDTGHGTWAEIPSPNSACPATVDRRLNPTPEARVPIPISLIPCPVSRLYSYFLTSNTAFSPPKAKELERATRTGVSRA